MWLATTGMGDLIVIIIANIHAIPSQVYNHRTYSNTWIFHWLRLSHIYCEIICFHYLSICGFTRKEHFREYVDLCSPYIYTWTSKCIVLLIQQNQWKLVTNKDLFVKFMSIKWANNFEFTIDIYYMPVVYMKDFSEIKNNFKIWLLFFENNTLNKVF